MPNLNYVRSVSPAFNALASLNNLKNLGGVAPGIAHGVGPLGQSGTPASPAAQAVQESQATAFRPPTQVYERSIFGNQFRDSTPEDRRGYAHEWRQDSRNVGHGAGQVDPGLAKAADAKDEAESGGK